VSAMSRSFVKDPHDVVKSGEVVKVKVLEVDVPRQRIALTLRLDDELPSTTPDASDGRPSRGGARRGGPAGGQSRGNTQGRGDSQTRGNGQGGRNRDGQSGRRSEAPAAGSMAEALRRAGFGK